MATLNRQRPSRRLAFGPIIRRSALAVLNLLMAWLAATGYEMRTGQRLVPWSAYAGCGDGTPAALPANVRIGLYEEFPVRSRLDKLRQLDFPVTLAVAAASRAEFLQLRETISQTYLRVR